MSLSEILPRYDISEFHRVTSDCVAVSMLDRFDSTLSLRENVYICTYKIGQNYNMYQSSFKVTYLTLNTSLLLLPDNAALCDADFVMISG